MVRTRGRSKPPMMPGPDSATSPAFAANSFMLTGWPRPLPETRDELQTKWNYRKDQATTVDVIESLDDGADDWEDFAGNAKLFPEPGDLERAVGSAFVNRAKRAYRAGKTWLQFEADEEAINSMTVAKKEHDPARYQILMKECLDNDLRLQVFEQLKEKLCTEIWGQGYLPREDADASMPTRMKKDSRVSSIPFIEPEAEEAKPRLEPDEYTVAGWNGSHPIWHKAEQTEKNEETSELETR